MSGTVEEQALELFSVSPALFVENQGQWADETVRYVHQGDGANVAMTDSGPVFQVFRQDPAPDAVPPADDPAIPRPDDRLSPEETVTQVLEFSATFVGANTVTPVGLEQSETLFNYFIGDQANWRSEVPGYEKVAYAGLYDDIDLVTWGQRDSLKYEFHVAPGADWSAIQVRYDGITGLSINEAGDLVVDLGEGWGSLTDDAPYIYQVIDGERQEVAGRFVLLDEWTYSFEITGAYDPLQALILDPDLAWSTYLGGSGWEEGGGIAVDSSGNILVTGSTWSPGWTSGGFDTTLNGDSDAFVVKLFPTGGHVWSSYLGGSGDDNGYGIAVDSSGNALVTGTTNSSGWVLGGFDTSYNGGGDAFVVKLGPAGNHLWSTYLGGNSEERGNGIAVDAAGNALVTGETWSSGWVSGGFDVTFGGDCYDPFVAKLSPIGSHLWSTYLGGDYEDLGYCVSADPGGNVLVTGYTGSSGWISGGFDIADPGGFDAFVVKLSPSGAHLWSSCLGGSDWDFGHGIAVDASGDVFVTGVSYSSGWVSGGWDTSYNGGGDAFVAKIAGVAEPSDAGDTLSLAANLGTPTVGEIFSAYDQIGNGSYGSKDVDLYKFVLSAAGTVLVGVDAQVYGSGLDAYLRLFNASGQELKKDDDTNGRDPFISTYLSPGTYYFGVSGYANRYYSPNSAGSGISGSTGFYWSWCMKETEGGGGGGTWSPTITASATYDGDPSASVFGRYLTGSVVPDLVNTFTAYVSAPTGYTTAAVCFDANFSGILDAGDWTDSSSSGGWTWDLNVSDLSGDKTLRIWAQESGGSWSDAAVFSLKTLAAPSWMDPDLTTITFSAASGKYEIDSLIGERIGVETPSFFPDFMEGTWNGVYAGISVQADMTLSGQVTTRSVAPTVGYSFLGFEQAYRFNLGTSFSRSYSLFQIIDLFRDPAGYFDSGGGSSGLTNPQTGGPTVTLSYSGQVALNNNLQFSQFNASFGMTLSSGDGSQFTLNLPKTVFPIPGTLGLLSLELTPHLGWSPSFDVGIQMTLGSGGPVFQSASLSVGATGYVGVTGEVSVLGGAASGGVDITGSLGLGFSADYGGGGWTYSIPLALGLDIDFVGSLLWGTLNGRIDVYDWAWTGDLWSSGGGSMGAMAFGGMLGGAALSEGNGPDPLTLVDADMARSPSGDIAYAWTVPSQDGTASPLKVQRMVGGVWEAPETLIDTDYHRGNPSIVSLGGDQWMAMWSQSNLPTSLLDTLTAETIVSQQEIWYAVGDSSGWDAPVRLTANSTCDDSPELVRLDDGRVLAVWRRMSGIDLEEIGASNLVWAIWDGADWTAPAVLADTGEQLSQPALAVLPGGEAVAVWLSDASADGSQVTVWSSAFDGVSWSAPQAISDAAPGNRNWSNVVGLSDGTALALWTEESGAGAILMSARRGADGTWGGPEAVTDYQPVVGKPEVAVAGSTVHIVYHGYEDENEIVGLSRDFADPASQWSEPELLTPGAGDAWWAFAEVDAADQVQIRYVLESALEDGAIVPLADLEVSASSLALDVAPAEAGMPNVVLVTVTNSGWAASDAATVALYEGDPGLGGTLLDTQPLSALAVGASEEVDFYWVPTIGSPELWAVVDPDGTLTERTTSNNAANLALVVLAKPTLGLDPASDTGTLGDGRTIDSTPMVTGETAPGTTVTVFVDSQDSPVSEGVVVGGTYSLVLPALANGPHTIWAQAYDSAGNPSVFSEPLIVHIDEAALPAPEPPGLATESDGGLAGDGLTNVALPTIAGQAKANATVEVYLDGALQGTATADGDGAYALPLPEALAEGTFEVTAVQTDEVGNVSPASSPFSVTVNLTPLQAPLAETIADGQTQRSTIGSVAFQFAEGVLVPSASGLILHNDTTGTDADLSGAVVEGEGTNQVTWDLSAVSLEDGYYTGTLSAAGATDTSGNPIAEDYSFTFHVLKCDANGDTRVDGGDLALWQQHYDPLGQHANDAGMGDWNGDGKIDGGDLALWQQRYNPLGLPAPMKANATPVVAEAKPAVAEVQVTSVTEPMATPPLATAEVTVASPGSESAGVDILGCEILYLSDQGDARSDLQSPTGWEVTLPQAEWTAITAASMPESTTPVHNFSADETTSETAPSPSATGDHFPQGESEELGLGDGLEDVLALPELTVPLGG
ncbi:MAG TPA: SBBP repeat-containing protein [Phycisphaerae bacterium]|nr:SBBP repeat-containing protein [Phycisphaerae bacterium]